jgi:UDP-GlcNAc:undecaprenyl-phosphate GlcNAc-1-phosphate transferase
MDRAEFLALVLSLALGFGGMSWLTQRYGWSHPNFRQHKIPAVAGLAFVLAGECFYCFEWFRPHAQDPFVPAAYFLVTLGFGLLGLLDDLQGDRSAGGFRGHLGALAQGKLTTGAIKALGGGLLALLAGYLLTNDPIYWHHPGFWWRWPLASLLIALSANTLNLLDLRPGRSLAGFLGGVLVILAVLAHQGGASVGFLLWFAAAVALILYPLDAGGRVMLGDTGSNAFGAVWGVAAVLYFSPLWQAVTVGLMLLFQLWCETHSLSQTIERSAILRRLDRLLGVR